MIKINATRRLMASAWTPKFELELPADVRQIVTDTMNGLAQKYPTIAHLTIKPGDPAVMDASGALASKSNNAIYLHPHIWLDHGRLKKHAQDWEGGLVDANMAGVIIHEVGHVLEGQVAKKLGAKKYNALLAKHIRDFNGIYNDEAPSPYGQENLFEFLAEAFTAHYMGKHAWSVSNEMSANSMRVCNAIWEDFNKILK